MFPVDLSDLERNHTVATFTNCLFDLGSSFWGPSIHVRFPRRGIPFNVDFLQYYWNLSYILYT